MKVMPLWRIFFFIAATLFRIGTLLVSIRHEKQLKRNGAVEYGRKNSILLALAHLAFYISAITEAALRASHTSPAPDALSYLGLALYAGSVVIMLLVMKILGRLWTVKLLIAGDHTLVTHPLFRAVRHPNYFLNILPELAGLALVLHAYWTLGIGLLLYLIPLTNRIREEERVMRARFPPYAA
jgi:isoprenylcysteine carboxyl methyltransferase (ICMT) family protein YpbQ